MLAGVAWDAQGDAERKLTVAGSWLANEGTRAKTTETKVGSADAEKKRRVWRGKERLRRVPGVQVSMEGGYLGRLFQ